MCPVKMGWERPECRRAMLLVWRKGLKMRDVRLWNNLYKEDVTILLFTAVTLN